MRSWETVWPIIWEGVAIGRNGRSSLGGGQCGKATNRCVAWSCLARAAGIQVRSLTMGQRRVQSFPALTNEREDKLSDDKGCCRSNRPAVLLKFTHEGSRSVQQRRCPTD